MPGAAQPVQSVYGLMDSSGEVCYSLKHLLKSAILYMSACDPPAEQSSWLVKASECKVVHTL